MQDTNDKAGLTQREWLLQHYSEDIHSDSSTFNPRTHEEWALAYIGTTDWQRQLLLNDLWDESSLDPDQYLTPGWAIIRTSGEHRDITGSYSHDLVMSMWQALSAQCDSEVVEDSEEVTKEYRVRWIIDIEASDPVEAARKAREIMLDPESIAQYFTVQDPDSGDDMDVDLLLLED